MKFAFVSEATAFAISVFPVPGGPCNKTPRGGSIPNLRKRIGCLRGNSIISRTFCNCSPIPPISSYEIVEIGCPPSSSSSTGSSLIIISVSGKTWTIPFGVV